MLPSENELVTAFGVSRQTIRASLRALRNLGLIEARHGIGSFILQARPNSRLAYVFDSAADLLQYAASTMMTVQACEAITLTTEQAQYLKRQTGERWWQVQTQRSSAQNKPIASSYILVPDKYGAILKDFNLTKKPIFALIQQETDETITEIWQDIAGTTARGKDAAFLDVPEGHPCLSIERRYFGRTGELFEVSYSIHPASTFSYSMRLHLGQQ